MEEGGQENCRIHKDLVPEASSVAGELESEITELSPVGSPVKCPAPANDGRVVTEANIHFEEKPKNSDSSEGGVRRETNLSDSG